ncbi:MAG: hypothetical protein KDA05_02845, partial [Phycisphaerales bacterium]|nr:hypothetical protein [Phycisphaerales bacterium]
MYPAADEPRHPVVTVIDVCERGASIDLEVRFRAGLMYCCTDTECHLPRRSPAWWSRLRGALADVSDRVPPRLRIRTGVVVEAGSMSPDDLWWPFAHPRPAGFRADGQWIRECWDVSGPLRGRGLGDLGCSTRTFGAEPSQVRRLDAQGGRGHARSIAGTMTQPAPTSNEPWTTRRLLAWMGEAFGKAGLESPRLQAEMLLAHVIGCQRLRLFMEAEREATTEERDRLRGQVARALRHEPIDYLVGERSFFGLLMRVDARVLVPRPSTETIVEFVLQAGRRRNAEAAEGDAEGAEREPEEASEARVSAIAPPGEVVFDLHDRDGMSSLGAFKPSGEELEEEDEAALERAPVKRT